MRRRNKAQGEASLRRGKLRNWMIKISTRKTGNQHISKVKRCQYLRRPINNKVHCNHLSFRRCHLSPKILFRLFFVSLAPIAQRNLSAKFLTQRKCRLFAATIDPTHATDFIWLNFVKNSTNIFYYSDNRNLFRESIKERKKSTGCVYKQTFASRSDSPLTTLSEKLREPLKLLGCWFTVGGRQHAAKTCWDARTPAQLPLIASFVFIHLRGTFLRRYIRHRWLNTIERFIHHTLGSSCRVLLHTLFLKRIY